MLDCRCLTGFRICIRFSVYQGSEYASGYKYVRVLNIAEFGTSQVYTRPWICMNNSWMSQFMYLTKLSWRALALHVSLIISSLLEHMVTYFNEVYSLEEHDDISLKRELIFSILAGSFFFCFFFCSGLKFLQIRF